MMYSGPGMARCTLLELFLSDQRFHDLLRFLFRRGSQRKNYLGQTRYSYSQVYRESDATIVAPLMFAWILGW